ncbi:recombinase family protein, partial [Enterococcus faecalis]|uniref:recombinase family protein n=1 Tax=Enterococcus faecalis TaxID=1351 RepID=UPI0030C8469B
MVKYALTNPLYIGKISWDGKVYDGHHTPIIDKSMYDKAQEIIARKAQKGGEQHGNQ